MQACYVFCISYKLASPEVWSESGSILGGRVGTGLIYSWGCAPPLRDTTFVPFGDICSSLSWLMPRSINSLVVHGEEKFLHCFCKVRPSGAREVYLVISKPSDPRLRCLLNVYFWCAYLSCISLISNHLLKFFSISRPLSSSFTLLTCRFQSSPSTGTPRLISS